MKQYFDCFIGKTITINDNTVLIDRVIGRGASCVTYECTLLKNGNLRRKMILKEFMPSYAGFPINEVFTTDSVEYNNNEIVGRYMPALFQEFEDAYYKYLETIKHIDALIDEILTSGSGYKRYLVPLPDKHYRKFNIDKEHHTYNAFMLFDYESLDIEKTIGQYSFIQRIKIVEVLCKVIAKFHEENLLFCDLKPSNFIYDFDDVLPILKLFDFDSVIMIDDKQIDANEVFGTPFFSAPEVLQKKTSRICKASDVYSIGAILLYFALYNQLKNENINMYKPITFLDECYINSLVDEEGCTQGFCKCFVETIKKYTDSNLNKRYNRDSNMQPAQQLSQDIRVLIDIFENRGIHPHLMFDYAKKQSDEFNKTNTIDENLLSEVTTK